MQRLSRWAIPPILIAIFGCSGLPPEIPSTPEAPLDAWAWWNSLPVCVQGALLGKNPPPSDLSGVIPLLQTKSLVIYPNCESPIETLEWIRPLEALSTLSVREQPITDLSPLASLESLTDLTFEYWKLSQWPAELTLPRLEALTLKGSLTDLSFLARHSTLKKLRLEGPKTGDLTPLAALDLEALSLQDMPVTDLGPLSSRTKLQELSLYNAPLSSLAPIVTMTGLRIFTLSGDPGPLTHPPIDLGPLGALPLTKLSVTNEKLGAVETLRQMQTVTSLDLSLTDLSSLDPIANLPLTELLLSETAVPSEQIEAYRASHPKVQVYDDLSGD